MRVSLPRFSASVRDWFAASFDEPTPAQSRGWEAIADGDHTLILAPTGSGKTLAAFLWAIDRLASEPPPDPKERTRVLYVSPLRALAVDVEKNLRAPLAGIQHAAERTGEPLAHVPQVGVRTGDTPARDRRRLVTHPPDILITTPESLYLMLTSQARETLRSVRWVIIDEIHALAATKRGAHLALSLERLDELTEQPAQRIGLSATQRPLDEIARFLGGFGSEGRPRPVTIVDAGHRKPMELEVVVPIEDMGQIGQPSDVPASGPAAGAGPTRTSIWPSIHPRLLELIRAHRSTIVFVNGRRLAERLAAQLNELADEDLVRTHHGSIAREQRLEVEDALKSGRLRAIVATSSLELGIDMGAVDLVVQVESPGSVASGLQRIGRAGHQVGEPSRGKIFPKFRGDLLEASVVAERMLAGAIEETRYPRNPLDVLAQQLVAMCAVDEWRVDELYAAVRRAANFTDLSKDVFIAVLDLLAGRYPSDGFAELRPRLVWDRTADVVRAREGAGRLAITSGGTIPDRGLFGVFLPDGTRVGELDEEMVFESRAGEVFLLGASSWRIEDITRDRVVVSPAPGEPGKMPFWHGDKPGRPIELGRAIGAFTRELRGAKRASAIARLREDVGLDAWAADNLVNYLDEQQELTGAVPDDRTVVVERFRDEIGDWRVCILSPFGSRVHAPWGMAIETRMAERFGPGAQVLWGDDGIVMRLPEAVDRIPMDDLVFDPDEIEAAVVEALPGTAMFASIFREASARALLLPRQRPGKRTPLWQQRQRGADLLAEAAKHPTFPMLLETTRECLRDIFDVPALREVMADLRSRKTRMIAVDTEGASPFAQSLLFRWIAASMYEGDAPLAERRAAALALDRDLLRELLGTEELRDLLDPRALDDTELELQWLADGRRARGADGVHDLLRTLGDLTEDEVAVRTDGDAAAWLESLVDRRPRDPGEGRRRGPVRRGGGRRSPSRRARRLAPPWPAGRVHRSHGSAARDVGGSLRPHPRTVHGGRRRRAPGRIGRADPHRPGNPRGRGPRPGGRVPPGGVGPRVGGRGRAAPAASAFPRGPAQGGRTGRGRRRWGGSSRHGRAPTGPAARATRWWRRSRGCRAPRSPPRSWRPTSCPRASAATAPPTSTPCAPAATSCGSAPSPWGPTTAASCCASANRSGRCATGVSPVDPPEGELHDAIRTHLAARGASFWPDLVVASGTADERTLLRALWDLVWAGEVTNDTLAPVRAFVRGASAKVRAVRPGSRPRPGALRRQGPPAGAGRWSLVAGLIEPAPTPTEAAHARALQLLDRHGVLTRESVLAENTPGGFAGVYPVLKAMEEAGKVRRGYFVAGLGAAQFALPGAVDRLRSMREAEPNVTVLAAADPAQPYGASLDWPDSAGRPSRAAGAYVVLVDGAPAAYLERGARSLATFGVDPSRWADALASLVKDGRLRKIELRRIDGEPGADSAHAEALREVGFLDGYRGLLLRG